MGVDPQQFQQVFVDQYQDVGDHIWIDGCRVFVNLHLVIETNLTRLKVGLDIEMVPLGEMWNHVQM